jgi:hypothetical protein
MVGADSGNHSTSNDDLNLKPRALAASFACA